MNADIGTCGAEFVGQAFSPRFCSLFALLKPIPPHLGNSLGMGGKSEQSPTLIKSAIPWARWVSVWQWKNQKPARRQTKPDSIGVVKKLVWDGTQLEAHLTARRNYACEVIFKQAYGACKTCVHVKGGKPPSTYRKSLAMKMLHDFLKNKPSFESRIRLFV